MSFVWPSLHNNAYYSCNNILTIIFYEEQLHITLCFVRKIYGRIFLLPLVNKVYVKINAIENATIICRPTLKFAIEIMPHVFVQPPFL